MKTYSKAFKTKSAILSIIISYFLVIINYQCVTNLSSDITSNYRLLVIWEYGGALLSIIVPVLLGWHIFKLKLFHILWVFPIIFLLVLIYSPSGYYFIIEKDVFLAGSKELNNWKYGIIISIMFFTIQFCAITIAKGILVSYIEKREKKRKFQ